MGLLSKVASFSGPLSAGIDYFSAKDTNKQAKKMAREQMAFQERMSNTSYQRAMEDMRRAGLNPMLAYMQGGASSPGGAQPTLRAPAMGNLVAQGLTAGSQIEQRKLQNNNIKEQNMLLKDQQKLVQAQTSSARGLAKQQNVVGDWYQTNPETAPWIDKAGAVGGAVGGVKSLMQMFKKAPRGAPKNITNNIRNFK